MTKDELIENQKVERASCSEAIKNSTAPKKVIVAGAGTGKTFTFKELLRSNGSSNNLAMTFINMLADDMQRSFGDIAEVKTFHAYCKRILHAKNGKVTLIPFLTKIIEQDAQALGVDSVGFEDRFQTLDETTGQIAFYLERGDYYDAVSFNDSVFRLYKLLCSEPEIVPDFQQIVIDEFQDFNALEVAFIKQLEQKGNILIVGDDDQAVYAGRNASPTFLRELCESGEYEAFELPFCSRCTEVIVESTNAFMESAEKNGHMLGRRQKRYECFVASKDEESEKYPKVVTATCSVGSVVVKYVESVIDSISADEIAQSWKEGEEYPTVLIIGPKHYLAAINKELAGKFPQMVLKTSSEIDFSILDGYELLLDEPNSNLGWRILGGLLLDLATGKRLIEDSRAGSPIRDLLDVKFVTDHEIVLDFIKFLAEGPEIDAELEAGIRNIVGDEYEALLEKYLPKKEEEKVEPDKSQPSILLTSFVGCKGLSAGHVIIVGANNGSIPKDPNKIDDVEIAQFMVALTRTRKQCHIVSNKWLVAPYGKGGAYNPPFTRTEFLGWIPNELIEDKGELSAKSFK
ncbi:MAG: ATP-dependent helicase [Blastocatellia bacterium]|nr:ATP-dependent helicase [Blastocatellia bacterium]